MTPASRLAWLDWLRVIAVASIFAAHVGQVFMPWADWFVNDDQRSRVVGVVILGVAPWLLPLFMLLSGYSVWHALERRGNLGFMKERVTRILLPLVIGLAIIVPPQVYAERRWQGAFEGSLLEFYPSFFTTGLYPEGNFALRHLWFLAHLFVYSAVALPLFRYWRSAEGRQWLERVVSRFGGRSILAWMALPLIAQQQVLWLMLPRDDLSTNDWSNMLVIFVAFLYGYAIAAVPELARRIDTDWPAALAIGVSMSVAGGVAAWNGLIPDYIPPEGLLAAMAFWSLYAAAGWAWVVAMLGLGRRYLNRESSLLSYGRRTAFAWYFLHQTVIVMLAPIVIRWQAGIALKLAGLTFWSVVLTAIGAEIVSRLWPQSRPSSSRDAAKRATFTE